MHKQSVKCDTEIQKQCVLEVNSYGCKLRYFRDECMMRVKENKEHLPKQNVNFSIKGEK